MDIKKICLLVLLTVALPASAWMPQQSTVEDGAAKERLKQWVKNMVMFNYMFPQEKVYVHLDNTGYFLGETIWLKAYVLRADQNRWTNMSQVLYVDLVTPSGEVFTTRKLPIRNGMAEGSIALEGFMNSGFYEVRAYTRYMANFDNHTAFSRVIPIFKKPEKEGDYSQATIDQTDYRSLQPQLREEAERLKTRGGLGVRFFPEGGRALVGQPCRVAVEVVDKNGRAVSTRCRLMQQQKETAVVTTDVHGRGYVSYTPGAQDDAYLLVDSKEGDKEQRFPLPAPSLSGVTLSVDVMGEQEVGVDVLATADQRAEPLGLVLMSRGNVKSFDAVTADGGRYHKTFQRKDLTDGVNLFGRNHYYGVKEGTSMAAPHVAGIIALWLQAKPEMTYADVRSLKNETSYNDEYTTNPERIPSGNVIQAGAGKIDALAGLQVLTGATGIAAVGEDGCRRATPATMYDADDRCYNTLGQRVNKNAKGIIICKGKLYVNP